MLYFLFVLFEGETATTGAGEMAQWLALVALPEDSGSISGTKTVAHKSVTLLFWPPGAPGMHVVQLNTPYAQNQMNKSFKKIKTRNERTDSGSSGLWYQCLGG